MAGRGYIQATDNSSYGTSGRIMNSGCSTTRLGISSLNTFQKAAARICMRTLLFVPPSHTDTALHSLPSSRACVARTLWTCRELFGEFLLENLGTTQTHLIETSSSLCPCPCPWLGWRGGRLPCCRGGGCGGARSCRGGRRGAWLLATKESGRGSSPCTGPSSA